jgi:hypothetical protein
MAIIADRGISGDKMLILGPQESLFFPFDFGDDWTQIRAGIYYSAVGLTGSNSARTSESVQETKDRSFLWGFTYSPDNSLPFSNTNNIYIGRQGEDVSISVATSVMTVPPRRSVLITGGITGQRSPSVMGGTAIYFSPSSDATGSGAGGYANINFIRLDINNQNKVFSSSYALSTSTQPNVSSPSLRSQIVSASWTTTLTGYYTTTSGDPNASMLTKPNKVLLHNPMLQNRLRIHNIVIEKYG